MTDTGEDRATSRPGIDRETLLTLVEGSLDGIMVVDVAGIVRFANPAAEATFGRDGSVVGTHFGVPLVAADKTDIDVPMADGEFGVFELRVADTEWDGTAAQLVTVRDVTGRARHEDEVRELNRRLQLRADAANVLSHIGDGVILVDRDNTVQLWNPAAERILNQPADVALGSDLSELVPGWQRVMDAVQLADAPVREQPRIATVVLEVDGDELWIAVTGVRFEAGVVYGFHDLTDEVRIEALKREFVDTAAHELRTPLTAICGAAHTLQRPHLDLGEAARDQLIDMMCTQANRLQGITESILATRRLDQDTDTHPLQLERIDAVQVAQEVVETVRAQGSGSVEYGLDVCVDGDRYLVADEGRLRQVLGNVIQNAMKYSPDGGRVLVRFRTEDSDALCIDVLDHGVGISDVHREHVFEKFYRIDDDAHRGIEGTGLGLYISRELMRRMGGDLTVDSSEGAGSTFTLRLPLRRS